MRRLLALALFVALAACNGAPLSTKWKLRSFNLNTADLSQLRIALRAPAWASPSPEATTIEARYWLGDDDQGGPSIVLRLRRGAHPEDAAALSQLASAPAPVVFELAPQSLGPAGELQLEAQRLKAQGTTHGRIHIGGAIACRHGGIPPGPIAIDAFVHTDDETGWLPLYQQHNVRGDMEDSAAEAELARLIPLCAEKSKPRKPNSDRGRRI